MAIVRSLACLLLVATGQLVAAAAGTAPPPAPALTPDRVAFDQCVAWGDGKELGPAPREALMQALCLDTAGTPAAAWSTGPIAGEIRHFRMAFTAPVLLGTVCTDDGSSSLTLSYLKDAQAFPGDLTRDELWLPLPRGTVKTAAPGTITRALRLTYTLHNLPWDNPRNVSRLPRCLLLQGRFWNPAARGGAEWGEAEVAKGTKAPQWTGFWPVPLPLAAVIVFNSPATPEDLAWSLFPGGRDEHPLAAERKQWQGLTPAASRLAGTRHAVLPLGTDADCRGLRLLAKGARREALPEILPLVALGAEEKPPTSFVPPCPFRFPYDMPLDGFLAVRVADHEGKDVRRLIAEVPRRPGHTEEPWDLKNDSGVFVKPGSYQWRGIARPPLKLTYEMTVYSAGRPPWLAPVASSWWMADHCPPRAVCAVGDRIFMGAQGAEFGIPLIATDLDGVKVWQYNQGVERLCSDGRYAYVVNDDVVVRFDPAKGFARQELLRFRYSDEVPARSQDWIQAERSGAAAGNGLLAVSYNAPEPPWITSAFTAGEVSLAACFPPPVNVKVHDTDYNASQRILSAFLTITSSQQAGFGSASTRGPAAHVLLLALRKDVPLGSIMLPGGGIRAFALRQGQPLPALFRPVSATAAEGDTGLEERPGAAEDDVNLAEDDDSRFPPEAWLPLKLDKGPGTTLAETPDGGVTTRYIAFAGKALSRLDYALVLNRRYRNVAPEAELLFTEGSKQGHGWATGRPDDKPLTEGNPATAALVWPKPTPVRGFALLSPMPRAGMAFDVWTGPADAAITVASLKDDAHWKQVYRHVQNEHDMVLGWHYHRVVHFDLGSTREVRALRLRLVTMPTRQARAHGGFASLVAFQPLGNDPPQPQSYTQRVTLVRLPAEGAAAAAKPDSRNAKADAPVATLLKHLALPRPGPLEFDAAGTLYAACDKGIVRIADPANQANPPTLEVVVPAGEVKNPRALACDNAGLLYVLDGATRAAYAYDLKSGKRVRTIGAPGGAPLGTWNPDCMPEPVALDIDTNGKLWLADQAFQPKRISRWSPQGTCEKELFGPTHYGGGGFIDPGDIATVNHLGMKFRIDWATRTSKLASILHHYTSRGMYAPDRPLYARGHRYLVGDQRVVIPFGDSGPTVTICEEKNGIAVPLVAAGLLNGWTGFGGNAAVLAHHRQRDLAKTSFVWCDLNRDSVAQPDEVQVADGDMFRSSAGIGDDLSINFSGDGAGWRLLPQEVRADGLPVYSLAALRQLPGLTGACMTNAAGETFVMGHHYLGATGAVTWSYPDHYMSVQRSNQVPWGFYDRPAGVLCGGLWPAGHFTVGKEELFCVNGNNGDYYAFTRDGLLAGAIVGGPTGYGKRFFSMPEWEPGKTDLTDLRKTVEDFKGWVTATPEGKVYFTVGKNHVTVVRCDGLERLQRLNGRFEVTAADIQAVARWATEKARIERAARRPAIFQVPFMTRQPSIDGETRTDWPLVPPLPIHEVRDVTGRVAESWVAALAYDSDNLYVAARATENSPMQNSAPPAELKRLFQFGDGVDVQLGLDPKADPNRQDPVPGDLRLVLAEVNGAPVAMLYRYRVPGEKRGEQVRFTSPVGETVIDEVRPLTAAKLKLQRQGNSWSLEAAIPWSELGAATPTENITLRGDVGALVSDPNGTTTVVRHYWSNRSNVVMSDLPSEARVLPALWGELRFAAGEIDDSLLKDKGDGAPALE